MTDLYGYKHPETGKRVIAVALRNKDAVLLGQGGPEAGEICYWVTEGYNYDHADTLSTAYGESDTSVSPIFIAAGSGIKEGLSLIHISFASFPITSAIFGSYPYFPARRHSPSKRHRKTGCLSAARSILTAAFQSS